MPCLICCHVIESIKHHLLQTDRCGKWKSAEIFFHEKSSKNISLNRVRKNLRRSNKNPPPASKKCFQQLPMSISLTKKFEWKSSSQLRERRFWKWPLSEGCLVKPKSSWFLPKIQKSFVFPIPKRFLIQIFFIGSETHRILC